MTKVLTVQIVEDNRIICRMLESQLRGLGYHINPVAHSADTALKTLKTNPADVVLMDIDLEGSLDGISTAKWIKKNWDIQIIFLSMHHDDLHFTLAEEIEPLAYISKPFNIYNLHRTIQKYFKTLESDIAPSHHFYIFTENGYGKIDPNELLYFMPKGPRQYLVFGQKQELVSLDKRTMMNKLAHSGVPFQQVHQEYVVNLNHVSKIDGKSLIVNDKIIPTSQKYRKELFSRLTLLSKSKRGA